MIIFEDLLWRAVGDQVALAHDIRTFTYGQCFTDVVVSNQHAKTAVAQMLNNTFNVDNGDGVNACKRFIQQDELRVCCQRACNFNTAAFPPDSA